MWQFILPKSILFIAGVVDSIQIVEQDYFDQSHHFAKSWARFLANNVNHSYLFCYTYFIGKTQISTFLHDLYPWLLSPFLWEKSQQTSSISWPKLHGKKICLWMFVPISTQNLVLLLLIITFGRNNIFHKYFSCILSSILCYLYTWFSEIIDNLLTDLNSLWFGFSHFA